MKILFSLKTGAVKRTDQLKKGFLKRQIRHKNKTKVTLILLLKLIYYQSE
jgi:hypothetical protein